MATLDLKTNHDSDDLNLIEIYKVLKRYKKIIFFSTLSFFLLGFSYAYTKKNVWSGEFQIVLQDSESNISTFSKPIYQLESLTPFEFQKGLKTDVEILKSSSILFPIYNSVMNYKSKKGYNIDSLSFDNWLKGYLNYKLIKGTSVLKVVYRDTEKQLILNVLDDISSAFQTYSNKTTNRTIDLGLEYLSNQINIYKNKALISLQNLKEYSIQHNLTENNINTNNQFNSIKNYQLQISVLEDIKEDEDKVVDLARNIPSQDIINIINRIDNIDLDLSYLSTVYTNSDIDIINTRKKRSRLINLLFTNSYDYLKSNLLLAQKTLDASIRPGEVIRKYIQLQQISSNDSLTLEKLQKEKILLSLEGEKNLDPWELVSRPFVNQLPVGPRRNRIIAFSSLLGFLFGILASLIIDKKKDIVFSSFSISKIIHKPILLEYKLNNSNSTKSLQLLVNSIVLSDNHSKLGMISVVTLQNPKVISFSDILSSIENKNQVELSDNIVDIESFNKFIIVIPFGSITSFQLAEFFNSIRHFENNIIGIIIIK